MTTLLRKLLTWMCVTAAVAFVAGCDSDVIPIDPEPPLRIVDSHPKWCPADSTKIAYTHHASTSEEYLVYGEASVWIIDLSSEERTYVASGYVQDWSPDGSTVAVWRPDAISLVDLKSGEERRITADPCLCGLARFSPLGDRISYGTQAKPHYGTWVLVLDSLHGNWVTHERAYDWSPEGQRLICDSLTIYSTDGTRVGSIPHSDKIGTIGGASWSPDGETVAFDSKGSVWVLNVDGSGERILAETGLTPCWSPSGSEVAFRGLSADGTASVIYVIRRDGSNCRQVTQPVSYVSGS